MEHNAWQGEIQTNIDAFRSMRLVVAISDSKLELDMITHPRLHIGRGKLEAISVSSTPFRLRGGITSICRCGN